MLIVWGKPIKRLYSAGEMSSIWGFLYQSGGNLGECLGLERMVGVNAAAESPLTN
jgi:3-oxosteroid 1-dehydrogenase